MLVVSERDRFEKCRRLALVSLLAQHRLEVGEWVVGGGLDRWAFVIEADAFDEFTVFLVLMVVAVQAQVFPVAAVGWIVVVVVVDVMDGQFVQVGTFELASAARAQVRVQA